MPGKNYPDKIERIRGYPFITYAKIPTAARRNLYEKYLESPELHEEIKLVLTSTGGYLLDDVVDKLIAVLKQGGS